MKTNSQLLHTALIKKGRKDRKPMYLNTEPKTSEALHLRISVNSAMTYSNKVYTAETKDEKGVAKVEFSTELFLHPFVIRCQQTGSLNRGTGNLSC